MSIDPSIVLGLKNLGWHFSEEALVEYLENYDETVELKIVNDWHKFLLNVDLHKIADKVPSNAEDSKQQAIFQIDKVRNVAVEKAFENEEKSKRLLKLTLFDGSSIYQAIEMSPINGLTPDTPPGTKISFSKSDVEYDHHFFLLNKSCRILGGKVPEMLEKWKANRENRGNNRQSGGGAPPWVPFGKPVDTTNLTKGFAAMGVTQSDSGPKVSEQFENSRMAVIAEAQATGPTKKFQPPTHSLIEQVNTAVPAAARPPTSKQQSQEPRQHQQGGGGRGRGRGRGRGGNYKDLNNFRDW